jgi:hypothetical protein
MQRAVRIIMVNLLSEPQQYSHKHTVFHIGTMIA